MTPDFERGAHAWAWAPLSVSVNNNTTTTTTTMNTKTYYIFLRKYGENEFYLGRSRSIRGAKNLAARHARGEVYALPEHLYETARRAPGFYSTGAPPSTVVTVDWFGRGGNYCAAFEGAEGEE